MANKVQIGFNGKKLTGAFAQNVMFTLLVVDDEPSFTNSLLKTLKSYGQRGILLTTPDLLPSTVGINRPDVVLLALEFGSGTSGIEICRTLRAWNSVPVIILADDCSTQTKVQALDAGADDLMTKPVEVDELLARVRSIHRRITQQPSRHTPLVKAGRLTIDLAAQTAHLHDRQIHLTRKEFRLLKILAMAEGQWVSYSAIMMQLWGYTGVNEQARIRTLVKQLRAKLGENLDNPCYILTKSGTGYRLNIGDGAPQ